MSKVKDKERIFKNIKKKKKKLVMYRGIPIRLSDFSAANFQARRECHNIFKVLEEKKNLPKNTLHSKVIFRIEGDRKSFSNTN